MLFIEAFHAQRGQVGEQFAAFGSFVKRCSVGADDLGRSGGVLVDQAGNLLRLFGSAVSNIQLLHAALGQFKSSHAADTACTVEQGVDAVQLGTALLHGLDSALAVHAGTVAAVFIQTDGVDRVEQLGSLVHIVQQIHEVALMGHCGAEVVNTHQAAGIQQLGQLALLDLAGQHDGVHMQPLKQLIVAAGRIGLANGIAHIQHQFGVQVQFDIFQFHSGSLLFAAQVNAG